MNDRHLNSALRVALARQAEEAPSPVDLVSTVTAASRRRGIRHRTFAAAGIAAAVVGVVLAVQQPWLSGKPYDQAAFGADSVSVCFGFEGDRLTELTVDERVGDELAETENGQVSQGLPMLQHTVAGREYTVLIEVMRGSATQAQLGDSHDVTVGDHSGRIGNGSDGQRAIVLDTGLDDLLLHVSVVSGDPTDEELLAWTEGFAIHDDLSACGSLAPHQYQHRAGLPHA